MRGIQPFDWNRSACLPYTRVVKNGRSPAGVIARVGLLALCAAGIVLAQLPEAPTAQTAEQFVSRRLSTWQKRLNLQDWKISIIMTRRGDLKTGTLGGIRWDKSKKTAVIRVQDSADYRMPLDEMLKDMEFTVVHELVHLELASLPRSEASRSNEEHAVNQIAEALLRLDRTSAGDISARE